MFCWRKSHIFHGRRLLFAVLHATLNTSLLALLAVVSCQVQGNSVVEEHVYGIHGDLVGFYRT